MQYYYGNQMPLRLLDEAEFWKQLEKEHTMVIRGFVPNLEQKYVDVLEKWEAALSETHQMVIRYIESVIRTPYYLSPTLTHQINHLLMYCLEQSLAFIRLCQQIKTESKVVSENLTAKVVIDHIIRESEYFVGIAQSYLYNRGKK